MTADLKKKHNHIYLSLYVPGKNENLFCQYVKRLDNDLVKRDEIPNSLAKSSDC